jgi:hypothetical protein
VNGQSYDADVPRAYRGSGPGEFSAQDLAAGQTQLGAALSLSASSSTASLEMLEIAQGIVA